MNRLLLLLPLLLAAPASAQVDSAVHKLCSDVKDYAGCVQAQMSLSQKSESELKTIAASGDIEAAYPQCSLKVFFKRGPRSAPIYEDEKIAFCGSVDNYNAVTGGRELDDFSKQEALTYQSERQMSTSELQEHYADNQKKLGISNEEIRAGEETGKDLYLGWTKKVMNDSCPAGKRQYQKTLLFGLIKGQKLCLSDYEAESLRAQQQRNIQNNMQNSMPRFVNCTSHAFGNYVSTSCY